jgi:hypothetical protein
MAHIASIRYTKALGNSALYVRARDATARYWDWTGLAWSATETAACKQALTERADSDAAESRYMASVALPPSVQSILEYVLVSTAEVLGEESTVPQAVLDVIGSVPSAPDPALCVLYDTIRTQAGVAAAGATMTAQIVELPHETAAGFFSGQTVTATAAGDGLIQWTLPRGAVVRVFSQEWGISARVTVPAQASARLGDLVP